MRVIGLLDDWNEMVEAPHWVRVVYGQGKFTHSEQTFATAEEAVAALTKSSEGGA